MDPVTTAIVAAVTSGATGAVLKAPIQDLYDKLKSLIRQRFGSSSGLAGAIDDLEKEPESEGRKILLSEKVRGAGAERDAAVVSAAEALLAQLKTTAGGAQTIQTARGSNIAQAAGGSHATVNVNQPTKPLK